MPERHERFPNLMVFRHPLIQDKLSRARDVDTPPLQFRKLLNEIAGLMTYEACRGLRTRTETVRTPITGMEGTVLDEPITLVPILRAGIGMTEGILSVLPEARVGHIGLYRDEESLEPVEYYAKFPPDVAEGLVLLIDPMLATGGSASAALTQLRKRGSRRSKNSSFGGAWPAVATMQPSSFTVHMLPSLPAVPASSQSSDGGLRAGTTHRRGKQCTLSTGGGSSSVVHTIPHGDEV